jgi:sulfur relay (sulfurtransferase) complex TusBCD TusD component (DsrE family)
MIRPVRLGLGPDFRAADTIDARSIGDAELLEGACRSSMDELTGWTLDADRVLVF